MVRTIIRLEGLAVIIASLYLYYSLHTNWLVFLALMLLPDIGMLGYTINKKLGAYSYNLLHNYILPLLLISLGTIAHAPFLTELGIIFAAHVGIDRFLGFGLKYPTSFKKTHIQSL